MRCCLRSATISKKRFYCCPLSKSKQERGCGFFKWFEEVNGESSTSTPSTTATPTFATSTTIEDLEIKYKIELDVAQAKMEMLQSITEDLAKIKLKRARCKKRYEDITMQVDLIINKVSSEAKKYKTAPLQHRDLLEKLFDGLSATGDFAWSSVPLAGVDYPWDGEAIPSYDALISPVREPTSGSTSRPRTPAPQSSRRRSAVAVQPLELTELVQSLISAFTVQGASHTSGSNDDTSDAVVQVLQEMVSLYEIDNALFFKSLKFLGGSNEHTYRLMFIRLRPEQRVSFLKSLMS
ncbi:hypothetical protein GIB67_018705 [Kingdonia uniflora]|uniref:GRF-type domain-containing protein n=1 Tax=Kingdonia uniflora TaxID=39325 RepID=A0A7J7L2B1_9MAGN|nr:hypothetical protein GIB67_018705 [Kingdonia uniflora]